MGFFKGEQTAGMGNNIRVGSPRAATDDRRIARRGVAERTEKGLASLVLQLPLGSTHPAVFVSDVPALEVKRVHHAVAGEPMVELVARVELRIWSNTIKRADQRFRQGTNDRQRGEGLFAANRRKIPV